MNKSQFKFFLAIAIGCIYLVGGVVIIVLLEIGLGWTIFGLISIFILYKLIFHRGNKKVNNACPQCGEEMVLRNGKYGQFYGCNRFPRCRGTRDL